MTPKRRYCNDSFNGNTRLIEDINWNKEHDGRRQSSKVQKSGAKFESEARLVGL